jgi:hypothetical protein
VEIDSQQVEIERSLMGSGAVSLALSADIDAEDTPGVYPTNAINCQGRYYVVLRNLFSVSTASAILRLAFYDYNGVCIGYTDEIPIEASSKSAGGGLYYGTPVVYANVFHGLSFKVSIESITAGNLSVFSGVV